MNWLLHQMSSTPKNLTEKIITMQSWKTTQMEHFAGNRSLRSGYYKLDRFFITYKRWNVWYEMRFNHCLN